jgi:hypothetical protein
MVDGDHKGETGGQELGPEDTKADQNAVGFYETSSFEGRSRILLTPRVAASTSTSRVTRSRTVLVCGSSVNMRLPERLALTAAPYRIGVVPLLARLT